MRPLLPLCLLLIGLAPLPASSALSPDGYFDPVAAARNATLHLQLEVTGSPVPDAGDRCTMPAVARRVFRADSETADQPSQPINPVSEGTVLTLVMSCQTTEMPFDPIETTGPLAERARMLDPPFDGSRRLRIWVPRERRVPRPGDVLETFLTPSRAPDGPCGEPFSVEQGRWIVPRPLTATRVARRNGTPQLRDPPGTRALPWAPQPGGPCPPSATQR